MLLRNFILLISFFSNPSITEISINMIYFSFIFSLIFQILFCIYFSSNQIRVCSWAQTTRLSVLAQDLMWSQCKWKKLKCRNWTRSLLVAASVIIEESPLHNSDALISNAVTIWNRSGGCWLWCFGPIRPLNLKNKTK